MINDKELRSLFKAESEEHLQGLEDRVLALEKKPGNTSTQADAMRHAHSLKGAARMLGLNDIEKLAHRVEDFFRADRDESSLPPDSFDALFAAIDGLKALSQEAITDRPADIDLAALLQPFESTQETAPPPPSPESEAEAEADGTAPPAPAEEKDSSSSPRKKPEPKPQPKPASKSKPAKKAEPKPEPEPARGSSDQSPAAATGDQIDTIRIHTSDLDRLLTDAGELTVARHRLQHHIEELQTLAGTPATIVAKLAQAREATDHRKHAGEEAVTRLSEYCHRELDSLQRRLIGITRHLDDDHTRLQIVNQSLETRINDARLLPLTRLFGLFPRTVRDLAQASGKRVRLTTQGEETTADKRVIEGLKDPIMHLIRNAIDHGIEVPETRRAREKEETGTILLRAYQTASQVVIEVHDDGNGLDRETIHRKAREQGLSDDPAAGLTDEHLGEIITRSGFTTAKSVTELSGRGVGLDVVARQVAELRGQLEIASHDGQGCRVKMTLPVSLATTNVVLLQTAGRVVALPTEAILTSGRTSVEAIVPVAGRPSLNIDGDAVPVLRLSDVLELPEPATDAGRPVRPNLEHYVIVAAGNRRGALLIDDVLDEEQVIVKPPGAFIRHLACIAGACILHNGEIAMVLRPADLLDTPGQPAGERVPTEREATPEPETVLLVEDSAVTRIQEKRILENAGYRVVIAVDGQDALEKLEQAGADIVVSDISMPRLDGLELTARIRKHPHHQDLPVVLMTMLDREEDRQRGLEAGASAYLMKSSFDQNELLDTVRRLL